MPIPIIDLFAGPGGLNEGFSSVCDSQGRSVFETALSVEMDEFAHRTLELRALYRRLRKRGNIRDYVGYAQGLVTRDALFASHHEDGTVAKAEALMATMGSSPSADDEIESRIAKALRETGKKDFVLIGGPPCQAYSLAGRARRRNEARALFEADPKQRLYREYLKIVRRFKPAAFLMENVPGLLSASLGGESTFALICADLREAGYDLHPLNSPELLPELEEHDPRRFIIQAKEHKIPQARARVFILGLRSDLCLKARSLPAPTGEMIFANDVLSGLPPIRSKLSKREDNGANWLEEINELGGYKLHTVDEGVRRIIRMELASLSPDLPVGGRFIPKSAKPGKLAGWLTGADVGGVLNHNSRGHMGSDLRRYFFWSIYADIKQRSPSLAEVPSYLRPDHLNITGDARDTPFADRFRVQVRGRPSTTITSHIAKDGHYYIHYDSLQCRSLSVREAARLQTFPDDYFFEGPVTEQYKQVGNAVPPYLAKQIGDLVASILR